MTDVKFDELDVPLIGTRLSLVDKKGNQRIVAGFSDENDAVFSIKDIQGNDRINIGVSDNGDVRLTLNDAESNESVQLMCGVATGPSVTIRGKNHVSGISIHFMPNTDYPVVALGGPIVGANGLYIGFSPDGSPLVTGVDSSGLKTFKID